ncbi:TOBE domain-containing protein [Gemmatimonadota bacterium]
MAVRPEEIDILGGGSPVVGAGHNVVVGRVTKTVAAETHFRVEIDCGVPVVAVVGRASFRQMQLEAGQMVQATFSAQAAHLIRRADD